MRMIEASEDAQPRMDGLGRFSDEMLLGNGDLASNDTRGRVRARKLSVTDGPFAETKEMIGAFALPTALSL